MSASKGKRGFVQLANDLFVHAADLGLDATDVAIVGVVEAHRGESGESFVSQKRIGECLGLGASAIEKRMRRLREDKFVVRRKRKGGGNAGYHWDFSPLFERVDQLPKGTEPSPASGLGAPEPGPSSGLAAPQLSPTSGSADVQPSPSSTPNPHPRPTEQDVGNKKREVNLSQGSDGAERTERAEEVHHPPLEWIDGNGNGRHNSSVQPPILALVDSARDEDLQLAHRLWQILDNGFAGLTDPKPTWKRPTEYAVQRVLERHRPGAMIAEEAACEARITLQQRDDGRNVVKLFEHKLKEELGKQAGVHRRVVATMPDAAGGAA